MSDLQDDIKHATPKISYFDSDIDSEGLNAQKKKLEYQRYSSDTRDRRWLAIWAAVVVTLWLGAVLIILVNSSCLNLSEAVLITLLGTTTLNVLGLTFIVLKGHFGSTS